MTEPKAPRDFIKKLVDQFLCWPIPNTVSCDPCATMQNFPNRSGTCLLTANEAQQMFEYLFNDELYVQPDYKEIAEGLMWSMQQLQAGFGGMFGNQSKTFEQEAMDQAPWMIDEAIEAARLKGMKV